MAGSCLSFAPTDRLETWSTETRTLKICTYTYIEILVVGISMTLQNIGEMWTFQYFVSPPKKKDIGKGPFKD